jgi:N-ethylmaleimide reductase
MTEIHPESSTLESRAEPASLFEPLRVGTLTLPNRVVMAPLGRARADAINRQPTASVARYYAQRASAGLIISEATHVSPNSVSRPGSPAIHDDAQVAAWWRVTEAVHAAGGRIFQQLFHLGRKQDPELLPGKQLPPAPSALAAKGEFNSAGGPRPFPVPRAVAEQEIPELVAEFRRAARNSKRAGFNGVEVHGANGFLIDQFLRDGANLRNDGYGGSIANRARFLLEVVDAVSDEFGPGRVGVRLSPHSVSDGTSDSTPFETFRYVAEQLRLRNVAYVHLIEPVTTREPKQLAAALHEAFRGPLIVCGGFEQASAEQAVQSGRAQLVAFGSGFIANPDLVERLRRSAPWNTPDPSTFYGGGDRGYVDYPFLTTAQ